MSIRHKVAALAAAAAFAGTAAATSLGSTAQAATQANISVKSIAITSMNPVNVTATLTNPAVLGSYGDASWSMKPNANTAYGPGWYFWNGHFTDSVQYYPGSDPVGVWHAYPSEAEDTNWNALAQNTATFYIKLGSRLSVASSRSGRYVSISGHASYYRTDLDYGTRGAWVNWTGQRVAIQVLAGTRWVEVAARVTDKNGNISAKISSPSIRSWRIQDAGNWAGWGATSVTIRR
jgi:hypothetical protein